MARIAADVTVLLDAWSRGEAHALDRLMEVVEEELRAIAGHFFRHERPDHTLQPTAVVIEFYLKLTGKRDVRWHSRAEFFADAAGDAGGSVPLDSELGAIRRHARRMGGSRQARHGRRPSWRLPDDPVGTDTSVVLLWKA